MSDLQQRDLPDQPPTHEGEAGPSEPEPVAPRVEGRETEDEGGGFARTQMSAPVEGSSGTR